MSRLLWVVGAVVSFSLVGCLEEAGAGTAAPVSYSTSGVDLMSYDDGSPLLFEATDPAAIHFEEELAALVNQHRILIGLDALQDSSMLRWLAAGHSEDQAKNLYFDHVNLHGDDATARALLAGMEVTPGGVGENIAGGYYTAQSAFDAWMASPGHREAIENPAWTLAGAGVYIKIPDDSPDRWEYYVTQNFAAARP